MIVAPLGSGSAGNAYYFESDGTSILVDAGFGPRETAKRLEITVHAVKFHLGSVYRKLGVGNRTEAAVLYLQSLREAQ